jgi:aminodeoxyfutalosine synthase
MKSLLALASLSDKMFSVSEKILSGNRITREECVILYESNDLALLSVLSSHVKNKLNQNAVYFNRNFHIEPTNICIYKCRFCSYSRKSGEPGAWELSIDEILDKVMVIRDKKITELHIVGGAHPERDLYYYADMLKKIKDIRPQLHIKAFTAVELEHMINLAGVSLREGLAVLKVAGLDSIPGGGAEIFNENIRRNICGSKTKSKNWLAIHEAAHTLGIPSNATMLYGHMETYAHRADHMDRLRNLQDKTGKFNAFIPLKYRNKNNELSQYNETTIIEDLKNYAVARIFLDNIPHLKAYWPMIGKETTQLSLNYGVDDIDGTIEDSTRIYTMAGGDSSPSLSVKELCELIRKTGRKPVERDSVYNVIKGY